MKNFCILGNPVKHSLSPAIFKYIFNILDIHATYDSKLIENHNSFINFIKNNHYLYSGFNITSPYKKIAYDSVDELDPLAKKLKSVNCIKVKDSRLIGYNTDYYGFKNMLFENNISLDNKKILILGYGGVARTIIFSLLNKYNCEIYIYGRNYNKIEKLINEIKNIYKYKIVDLFNNKIKEDLFMINCLPLKIGSKNVKSLLSYLPISNINMCLDINYIESDFSLEIKKHFKIISGIDMLIYQALKSFDIWFENNDYKKINYLDLKKSIT